MLVAVFALLLLLNRNTGGLLQGILLFILPIPMTAYAVMYGGKASVVVFACMVAMTFFVGSATSIFYAISSALVGLVQGTRIYHKKDMTRTMFLAMGMCMVAELLDMVVIAQLTTGQGLDAMVTEMQEAMNEAITQALNTASATAGAGSTGITAEQFQSILNTDYLRRMLLVAIGVTGVLEGFVEFEVSVLILRKLRMHVPAQRPIAAIYPPRWTGLVGLIGMAIYMMTVSRPFENAILQGVLQTLGIVCYFYLMAFGIIAVAAVLRTYVTRSKLLTVVLTLLCMFLLPYMTLIMGAWYIMGGLHDRLLEHAGRPTRRDDTGRGK